MNNTTVVNGKILDKNSGNPLAVSIEFTEPSGNSIKTQSGGDGFYQQVLKEGIKYTVSFKANNILNTEEELFLESQAGYKEHNVDFELNELKAGNVIMNFDAFNSDASTMTADGQKMFDKLKNIMQFNRSLYIEIIVNDSNTEKFNAVQTKTNEWKRFKRKIKVVNDKTTVNSLNDKFKSNEVIVRIEKIKDPFE